MEDKRLFLLDAYALIFRAYYALIKSPIVNSKGMNTSAIFGFVNTLEELLRKENPTHLAVCFDPQGPTFRHEAFEQYKAEREATPEDIKQSIPIIKEIVAAYRIPMLEVAGYEADDVIGTMAERAAKEGYTVYMMTPDKDYGQLVSEHIIQYKPAYRGKDFEFRGPAEVCAKYELQNPRQMIDLLALMGDKVDNIPGCPGVGEKTAVKLIGEYGSVENMIEHAAEIKGALGRKIAENAEQIRFSKYLATICTDVPVEVQPNDLKRQDADLEALFALFKDLGFRSLTDRVKKRQGNESNSESASLFDNNSNSHNSTAQNTNGQLSLFDDFSSASSTADDIAAEPEDVVMEWSVASDSDTLDAILEECRQAGRVGLGVLTSGKTDVEAVVWGFGIVPFSGKGYYVPANADRGTSIIRDLYADENIEVVSADVKRDYVAVNILGREEFKPANYYDVCVAHYLLEPEQRHSLANMLRQIAGLNLTVPQPTIPPKKTGDFIAALNDEQRGEYACRIADAALRLRPLLDEAIRSQNMSELLYDIELPLIKVLADMELAGVRIDVEALDKAAKNLSERICEIEAEVYKLAGEEFNVSSPGKVGEILFDKLALDPKAKRTRTGQYSTSEDVLEKIADRHSIVRHILEFRKLKKLLTTYLTALPECINPATGKIHTNYNQTVTATGRISSSDPNLQNIPVRDDVGREIRRAFIPDDSHLFLSADYSQIELRLVADFAGDETMLDAFKHGIDIHSATAAKIFKEPLEAVDKQQRRAAKTANFGILYGISAFGLAQRLSIPRGEAKALIDGYFATFPSVHRYMETSIEKARAQGYVTTICGRRRTLIDINSRNAVVRGYAERNAINAPIQGSAADIIKIAMVAVAKELETRGLRSKMIMQVHDELNFDVIPDELEELKEIVKTCMEDAYKGRVRLEASMGVGKDWLSAH